MDGPDPGATCTPVCLLGPADDKGVIPIYVTTECPPIPRMFDQSGASPDCARALDVFAHGPSCASLTDAGARD